MAMSLCADCFAVTACSSLTLKSVSWRSVGRLAVVFAAVQTLFLFAGWMFGDLLVGFLHKVAGTVGFALLLYVGGSMILEGLRGGGEQRDLDGIRNVILGAAATSIDALAVGVSMSMASPGTMAMIADHAALFVVTALSVVAGVAGGYKVGLRYGRRTEIAGGMVLIFIGLNILFKFI